MIKRTILFVVLCAIIWTGSTVYHGVVQPEVASHLALAAVNGNAVDAAQMRVYQQLHNKITLLATGLTLVAGLVCYSTYIKRGINAVRKEI